MRETGFFFCSSLLGGVLCVRAHIGITWAGFLWPPTSMGPIFDRLRRHPIRNQFPKSNLNRRSESIRFI